MIPTDVSEEGDDDWEPEEPDPHDPDDEDEIVEWH